MRTITGHDELRSHAGTAVGTSGWLTLDQDRVDAFADLTGDHQFIHVDPARARETPFGGTVVHGFFTLSLIPRLTDELLDLQGFAMLVNYGLGRVRFPAPLPVGVPVRGSLTIAAVEAVGEGTQATMAWTFEREGGDKPVCVAESLVRVF